MGSRNIDKLINRLQDDDLRYERALERIQVSIQYPWSFWMVLSSLIPPAILSVVITWAFQNSIVMRISDVVGCALMTFVIAGAVCVPSIPALYQVHLKKKKELMILDRRMLQQLRKKYPLLEKGEM